MPFPSGRDAHHDTPLANLAIKAFSGGPEGFIGQMLFPVVPVGKQSDRYYVIDKDSWIRLPNARRSPRSSPNRIEWQVASDAYYAENYALAGENAKEDLANADMAIRLRENTTQFVTEALMRDREVRIATTVTASGGPGAIQSVASKWSDGGAGSDPIADVTTAHAFIRNRTGLIANTLAMDFDTLQNLRRHSKILEMFKYTSPGLLGVGEIAGVFGVDQILVARGIKNNAKENQAASLTNIWPNFAFLARIEQAPSLQAAAFGLSFRWQPEGIPAPMQVFRYDDPDPGKKTEVIEVGYYQAERIVARDLGYLLSATL